MSNSKATVRVRFAPSPTGFQHIGNLHSALFNYLFARHHHGVFIIRLEDTDRERFIPEAEDHLFKSLNWLNIMPDESSRTGGDYGPYVQSERLGVYKKHADELIEKGALYRCWCTPERLSSLRDQAQKDHRAFKYDRYCIENPGDPLKPHVLRFRIPDGNQTISWDDTVIGLVEFNSQDLDDFVCIKSDGFPTYHFANVVDDHLMKISHVMRAAEWIPSTPKHILLYEAFNWTQPQFIHLPQVLGPDGKRKLSKRDGAKDILDYAHEGYLTDAVVNFMTLLGWNEGSGTTQELYSRDELIKAFSAERIQKSPAVFDAERLDWMNGLYIRHMPIHELLRAAEPFWPPTAAETPSTYKQAVLELVQDRLKKLSELPLLTSFFFIYTAPKVPITEAEIIWLKRSIEIIKQMPFDASTLEAKFRGLVTELETTNKLLFGFLRTIITGEEHTPPLFETMTVLGQATTLNRLQQALKSS